MSPRLKDAMRLVEIKGLAPLARVHNTMPKDFSGPAYSVWKLRQAEVEEQVANALFDAGGTVTKNNSIMVRYAGIAASSTIGLDMALNNWMTAAKKRINTTGGVRG